MPFTGLLDMLTPRWGGDALFLGRSLLLKAHLMGLHVRGCRGRWKFHTVRQVLGR